MQFDEMANKMLSAEYDSALKMVHNASCNYLLFVLNRRSYLFKGRDGCLKYFVFFQIYGLSFQTILADILQLILL